MSRYTFDDLTEEAQADVRRAHELSQQITGAAYELSRLASRHGRNGDPASIAREAADMANAVQAGSLMPLWRVKRGGGA